MEVHPGRVLAYELTRPGRRFRIEFDLQIELGCKQRRLRAGE